MNYTDGNSDKFMFYIWNEEDLNNLYNDDDVVQKFDNKGVQKMRIQQHYPSLSITTLHPDNSFMSELVMCNCHIDIVRFVDYRKIINLEAYQMFIFHNENPETRKKEIVVAPINSQKFVQTN
jgi:hypothetical protein